MHKVTGIVVWLKRRASDNARVLKYGVVGSVSVLVNLGTMALLLAIAFPRGWILSAAATVMSTLSSFILHNSWTFSDRQHKGLRLLRGFLFFGLMAVMGIFITAWIYVGLMRTSAHLAIVNAHPGNPAIPLACQLVAILVVAGLSFLFNLTFTWPRARTNGAGDAAMMPKL